MGLNAELVPGPRDDGARHSGADLPELGGIKGVMFFNPFGFDHELVLH